MAFQRDFNGLLNEILSLYKTRMGDGAVDAGTVLFIKASCTASMLWGLYQTLAKAADQMFVESADRAHKERHAAEFGIPTDGLSDAEIVDAVLNAKRSKLAGGNRYDYVQWAREVTLGDERITYAEVIPLARGEGTFDIVVVSNLNNGVASDEICDLAHDYIQERRPIGSGFSNGVRICKVSVVPTQLTVAARGANWDQGGAAASICSCINGLLPGETMYLSHLLSIMLQYGAIAPRIVEPIQDMVPEWSALNGRYEMLRMTSPADVTIEEDVL